MRNPLKSIPLLALTAATLLSGCGVPAGGLTGLAATTHHVVAAAKGTGHLRVAFAGLAPYRALATTADIAWVQATLTDARGQQQSRKVAGDDLRRPSVYLDFANVPAGKADLQVLAFDQNGSQIGAGDNGTQVAPGAVVQLHVDVKLDPNAGTGQVQAVVTFTEVPPPPPPPHDGVEIFRAADVDGDGYLDLQEFLTAFDNGNLSGAVPTAWPAGSAQPEILIPACDPVPVELAGKGINQPVAPMANDACNPVVAEFNLLDMNHDGRLSITEFLVLYPEVIMDPPAPTPVPMPVPMPISMPGAAVSKP